MITSAVLSRASAIVAPSEPPAHLVVQQSARRVLESVTHRLAQAAKSWGADSSLGIETFTRDGGGVNISIWINDHESRRGIEEPPSL
jgi:hypothetical protein